MSIAGTTLSAAATCTAFAMADLQLCLRGCLPTERESRNPALYWRSHVDTCVYHLSLSFLALFVCVLCLFIAAPASSLPSLSLPLHLSVSR